MTKKEKINSSKSFNAYQYAHEFEKLSLEVVNVIFKENFNENEIIHKDVTKETRDKGVDAYLIFNIKNSSTKYTCTIEAKLRTSETLSLKDFATSILYYLINTSVRHYVVTNVTYSPDAIKYIQQFNLDQPKDVELIDGKLLQNTINKHLSELYDAYSKELIDYIVNKSFPKGILSPNVSVKCTYQSVENLINLSTYDKKIKDIETAIDTGYRNFMIVGNRGTGKSSLLKIIIRKISPKYTVYKFDLSIIQTPKLFMIEFLRNLLNLDIDAIFSSFASDEKYIDKILKQFQTYDCCSSEILNCIKMLISNSYTPDESIYLFGILIKHLIENFLIHKKSVILIENLHEASLKMIKFIMDSSEIICNKNMLLFWELLLPVNSYDLIGISLDQWYRYIYLLNNRQYNNNPSYCISMEQFSKNDLLEIFAQCLPELKVTNQYINQFIATLGLLPSNVFPSIQIIKNKGIFSTSALKQFEADKSLYNAYYIKSLFINESFMSGFYKKSFALTMLLSGRLKAEIIEFLSQEYKINSYKKLMDTGLYVDGNGEIIFPSQYMPILNNIVDTQDAKHCACWLLNYIDLIYFNQIEKKYYNSYFRCIVEPDQEIKKINGIIKDLIKKQAYKYVFSLAEFRYKYYEEKQESYLCFKYYISYIDYVQKSGIYSKEMFYFLLKQADLLQANLGLDKINTKDYFKIDIQYSFIKYRWAKLNYNYSECEKNINNILKYEQKIVEKEIFATARIYHALIKKEYGLRKEFIVEMIENLRKYPNIKDVKTTYYVNIAAMYKHDTKGNGISIATKLLQIAQDITYNSTNAHGDLEVEIGLLNLMGFQSKLCLEQIQRIQLMAEKYNAMQYLAKTFNLAAYYYFKNGNSSIALSNLNAAIYHSVSSGQSKQFFLFGLNLLTIMIENGEKETDEFAKNLFDIFQWFKSHQKEIVDRLMKNPYYQKDHMYAAILSLICIMIRSGNINMIQESLIFQCFPELECELFHHYKAYIKKVSPYYVCKGNIFILF